MRVKLTWLLLAVAINAGLAVPAGAMQEKCPSPKEQCDNSCTLTMEIEAVRCSVLGFTAQAAVCHSVNMAQYGGCLA